MALEQYRRKRAFRRTPEPQGLNACAPADDAKTSTWRGLFCVQRHQARQLHYDLRLEVGGVLKSWAIPKGPTLDPQHKRMAVLVEDHPLEYADFEGVIPEGNYGAGSVMLYDRGPYETVGQLPAEEQIARGDFKFCLYGQKLKGEFVLARRENSQWLLIKKKDFSAIAGWEPDMYARSVKTGRTQEEIASHSATALDQLAGAVRAPMPAGLTPMLATSALEPPSDPGWAFEVKWDGVRALCYLDRNQNPAIEVFSRNGKRMNQQYPEISALADALNAKTAVVDGEIVMLNSRGVPDFTMLQRRMHLSDPLALPHLAITQPVTLYVFDLLYLDGWDLRGVAFEERKRLLAAKLTPSDRIRFSDHFIDQGPQLFDLARQNGLEGILAKRLGSVYESRRSPNWLKIKVAQRQEFVIAGWSASESGAIRSLLLGAYEGGSLIYVGNVGSGFDESTRKRLLERLQTLRSQTSPFPSDLSLPEATVWVRPELVCEVKFHGWTADKRLRAASFLGLRNDVSPQDCLLETPDLQRLFPLAEPLLTDSRPKVTVEFEGKRVTFTNLNKVYFPEEGVLKRDIVNYYAQVADLILPYLRDRPLALRRYPDGIHGESFFQKAVSEHFPKWLRQEPIASPDSKSPTRFAVADDLASLLYLVNLGCVDHNPWMSRIASLEHPDFVLIDLDPQDCGYDRIVEAARCVREKLEAVGLEGYPKTTGGDGMHIYIPIEPVYSFEQARTFAQLLAYWLAFERPDLFTTERTVSRRRKNRVYLDWMQVASGKTISAPYVLRAYPGAPVATPLEWREVRPGLDPRQFHLRNARQRFERVGDLFSGVLQRPQRLETALPKLEKHLRRQTAIQPE
ncbi:MAG: DNA ligase D [Bryobacteraceae bacterium]|nr:DNA ligase D [Bryobacteraceae bacterium]MDW8379835.1 DNA ligase D [Bryobacterales bacterium]